MRLRGHRYEIGSGVFLPSMRMGVRDRFGKITTIMMSTNEEECVLIPMLLEAPESDAKLMTCVVIDPTSPASNILSARTLRELRQLKATSKTERTKIVRTQTTKDDRKY